MIHIALKKLPHGEDLPLPSYGSPQSAGLDLAAAIDTPLTLTPGMRALVPCGFAIALDAGYEAQIRPRSGLALKHGITILNAPGTIDADYRGEIMVILINHGGEPFVIERGMRIAQMVIAPYTQCAWTEVDDLDTTQDRGGGFGSTGLKSQAA